LGRVVGQNGRRIYDSVHKIIVSAFASAFGRAFASLGAGLHAFCVHIVHLPVSCASPSIVEPLTLRRWRAGAVLFGVSEAGPPCNLASEARGGDAVLGRAGAVLCVADGGGFQGDAARRTRLPAGLLRVGAPGRHVYGMCTCDNRTCGDHEALPQIRCPQLRSRSPRRRLPSTNSGLLYFFHRRCTSVGNMHQCNLACK
jgi:hypothetical protein